MDVPLTVLRLRARRHRVVAMAGREQPFSLEVSDTPLSLHVDPDFDLFRLLDPRETPASIGQIFGEPKILAVIPAAADAERQARYRQLLQKWVSDAHAIDVVLDSELTEIPADRCVWILGHDNRYRGRIDGATMRARFQCRQPGHSTGRADGALCRTLAGPGPAASA